jgi:hypothetical protein
MVGLTKFRLVNFLALAPLQLNTHLGLLHCKIYHTNPSNKMIIMYLHNPVQCLKRVDD